MRVTKDCVIQNSLEKLSESTVLSCQKFGVLSLIVVLSNNLDNVNDDASL